MKLLKYCFPICFTSTNIVLFYHYGGFFLKYDIEKSMILEKLYVKHSIFESILCKSKLYIRLLRKGVRCGIKLSDNSFLVYFSNKIKEIDFSNNSISNGYVIPDGSRPLHFCDIRGIKGFEDGIYFGGYKSNIDLNEIHIYKRVSVDKWEVIYTFPKKSIEHIHNIVPDRFRNIVYILTGDHCAFSGIWVAENNFTKVTPILTGNQLFRSCVAFPVSEGLVYATDSPYSSNSIRLLTNSNSVWTSEHLYDINGPSIYGCKWGDDLVFSTSVESNGIQESILHKTFSIKRGRGIRDMNSHIYFGNISKGFKDIYQVKKDLLPFYPFQFGVLIFPSGNNNSRYLPIFHVATKKYDLATKLFNFQKITN